MPYPFPKIKQSRKNHVKNGISSCVPTLQLYPDKDQTHADSGELLISKPNNPQPVQKQVRSSTFHVNTILCVSPLRPVRRYRLLEKRGHKSHSARYVAKSLMIKNTALKMS